MTRARWSDGNRVELLENGEEYYPRVFEAIAKARSEVLVETFIVFEDPIGNQLRDALVAAAGRGLRVELCVDGYGSAELTPAYVESLTRAGVRFHVFDPRPTLLGMRTNLFRRLHRKIVVVDARLAFIGGLNFSVDHVLKSGPEAKQDYAVEVSGPVVADIRHLAESLTAPTRPRLLRWPWRRPPPSDRPPPPVADGARVALVHRDNVRHRDDIERHYREAIRAAKREIVIANAYFFPGYRLLRDLRNAARRGVRVNLILQGNPDQRFARWAGTTLYDYLLRGGARIHEYCDRPLHGKVAVVDDDWSTVGSSNLDPLSLFLNLEANLVIIDRDFNQHLRAHLGRLMRNSCKEIPPQAARQRTLARQVISFLAFHVARRFPALVGWRPLQGPSQLVTHLPGQAPVAAMVQTPLPAAPASAPPETSGTR